FRPRRSGAARAPPPDGPRGRARLDRRRRAGRGDARRDPPAQARAAPGTPSARPPDGTARGGAGAVRPVVRGQLDRRYREPTSPPLHDVEQAIGPLQQVWHSPPPAGARQQLARSGWSVSAPWAGVPARGSAGRTFRTPFGSGVTSVTTLGASGAGRWKCASVERAR